MRFLIIFIFLCLEFFSFFAVASEEVVPSCMGVNWQRYAKNDDVGWWRNNCVVSGPAQWLETINEDPVGKTIACHYSCVCPPPTVFNVVINNGLKSSSCIDPGDPGDPEPEPLCDESEKVYDPVSGAMVCPASGDGGSSSASSQTCVVPNDFNGDCIPDDEQRSSAANSSSPTSTPTSSPDSGSSGSAASTGGGGDDDGDDPSTGGGGDNGGGNNSGGGSASSSVSASGGGSGSGSNSSWTPNSGYGNWIPVNPNSLCPNKYQDKDGQWWCWGGQSNSVASNSAGSAGSASSGANSSSPYGGGGECDDEPVCPEGDIECLQFIQLWHTRCGGEKIDSKFFEMADQGDAEASFSKSFTNFKTELEKLPNTQHIQNFFQFNASGSCPVWQVNAWVFDVVIDQQCSSDIPWDLIAGVIIAVSVLLAARIALT